VAVNEDHMKAALEYVNGGQMEKDFKSGSRELYVSLEDVYSIPRIGQESQVPIQMLLITTAQVSRSNPVVVERFFVYLCIILSRIAFAIIF
jgi:hypothetical protein